MKLRRLAPTVLALAALSSIAAVDADGIELPTEPCANEDDALVLSPGAPQVEEFNAALVTYPSGTVPGLTGDPSHDDDPANLDPMTRTSFDVIVDLSSTDNNDYDSASVFFLLEWESPSDHELFVYDSEGEMVVESTAFNPLAGSEESGSVDGVEHCAVFTVETKNYLGEPGEAMTLTTTVIPTDDEPNTVAGEDTTPDA